MTEQIPTGRGGYRPGSGRKPGKRLPDHERLLKAKADKEAALAKLRELEAQKASGELLPVDTLRDVLADVAAQINAIMDAIPVKLKREAPHLSSTDIDIVKREIAATMNAAAKIRYEP